MLDRKERRKRRLLLLIEEAGGNKQLADAAGKADSMISQLRTAKRAIGEKMAQDLEQAMGKPDGWMDQWLVEEGGWEGAPRNPDWHLLTRLQDLSDEVRDAIRKQIMVLSNQARKQRRRPRRKKETA